MQVTDSVHALKIPFQLTTPSGAVAHRFVYVYLVIAEKICLVDSGVAGSENAIFNYIRKMGRNPDEIAHLILTHSHPDHIGGARAIKNATGCAVHAHSAEKAWIEDIQLQSRERPVPGFDVLVGGSVGVDRALEQGDSLKLGERLLLDVLHTPGHSRGSISLRLPSESVLFTGDAIPLPGDIPIYEDVEQLVRSIEALMYLDGIRHLLASWDDPRQGKDIALLFRACLATLRRIHESVIAVADLASNPMEVSRMVLDKLELPQTLANPLVAKSLLSHLSVRDKGEALFHV